MNITSTVGTNGFSYESIGHMNGHLSMVSCLEDVRVSEPPALAPNYISANGTDTTGVGRRLPPPSTEQPPRAIQQPPNSQPPSVTPL